MSSQDEGLAEGQGGRCPGQKECQTPISFLPTTQMVDQGLVTAASPKCCIPGRVILTLAAGGFLIYGAIVDRPDYTSMAAARAPHVDLQMATGLPPAAHLLGPAPARIPCVHVCVCPGAHASVDVHRSTCCEPQGCPEGPRDCSNSACR